MNDEVKKMPIKKDQLSNSLLALLEKLKEVGVEDVANLISDEEESERYDKDHIDELRLCYKSLLEKARFQEGQIVKWKKYMKNKKLPKRNQPAIVVKMLDEPILEDKIPLSSPYYGEPLDVLLGIFHDDGSFITFYYDSRRFEVLKDSEEK